MIASEVLEELRSRGATIEARGSVLHVEAPRGALSPDLVAAMRQLKPELLRLAAFPSFAVGAALGGVTEIQPSLLVAEVCGMRLDDFSHAGLVVEVCSDMLGEAIVFASDNACVDPGELRTVYRAHELQVLLGLSDPRELRRIHEIKRLFRGTITDSGPSGS